MILTRQGNKTRIADKIYLHFPKHKTYIELFFGAGGMFFNKPMANNNICNDIESEVFNFWNEVKFNKDYLLKELEQLPIHDEIWKIYKKQKPLNKTIRAALFLMYSNFGYMGKDNNIGFSASSNYKDVILYKIDETFKKIKDVLFLNDDFRNVLPKIKYRSEQEKQNTFIYSDPPYLNTYDYKTGWKENDTIDCFQVTFNSGLNAAMSEFNNPIVLDLAKQMNLNIINIGERQSMKNRNIEILITNYKTQPTLF